MRWIDWNKSEYAGLFSPDHIGADESHLLQFVEKQPIYSSFYFTKVKQPRHLYNWEIVINSDAWLYTQYTEKFNKNIIYKILIQDKLTKFDIKSLRQDNYTGVLPVLLRKTQELILDT